MEHSLKWLWLSALVIGADRITKLEITRHLEPHRPLPLLPGLDFTLVHNTGAAFSFLQDAGGWQRWFFIALSSTVSVAICVWLARLPARRRWMACALALILGGAAGNLWDRVALGYVIDFIHIFYRTWHWPAFNLADSAITCGAVMLIIDAIWFDRAEMTVYSGGPDKH